MPQILPLQGTRRWIPSRCHCLLWPAPGPSAAICLARQRAVRYGSERRESEMDNNTRTSKQGAEEGQSSAHSDDGRRHPHPPPSRPANGVDVNREDSARSVTPCASVAMQRREAGQKGLQRTWRCVEVRSKMTCCECRVYQTHTTGQAKYGQARYSKAKHRQGTASPSTGKEQQGQARARYSKAKHKQGTARPRTSKVQQGHAQARDDACGQEDEEPEL